MQLHSLSELAAHLTVSSGVLLATTLVIKTIDISINALFLQTWPLVVVTPWVIASLAVGVVILSVGGYSLIKVMQIVRELLFSVKLNSN